MNENVQNICGILRIQVEHGIREMDFPGSPQIRSWDLQYLDCSSAAGIQNLN